MIRSKWRTRYLAEKLRADEAERRAEAIETLNKALTEKNAAMAELLSSQKRYIEKLEELCEKQDTAVRFVLELGEDIPQDPEGDEAETGGIE